MIRVDLSSSVPLAEQIRLAVRRAIAEGDVAPGEELPPVRQLAGDLEVNLNTVARAYRELEREGLVVSQRGRGTVVASDKATVRMSRREIRLRLRDVLADARLSGVGKSVFESLVRKEVRRGAW